MASPQLPFAHSRSWSRSALARHLAILSIAVTVAAISAISPSASDNAAAACGSFQTRVNNAKAGSTITIPKCTFRESVSINKKLTIKAYGAVVDGENVRSIGIEVHANGVKIYGLTVARVNSSAYGGAVWTTGVSGNPGWEGGGGKIAASDHVTFSKNRVHHNGGVGIWFDVGSTHGLVKYNRVYSNTHAGIFFEVSRSAQIYGNRVWRNGRTGPAWGYGAGIQISSSDGARVHDNIVAWNARGISVISQERGPTPHNGNLVYENTIISATNEFVAGFYDDHGGSLWSTSNGNKGYDNRYWVGGARTSYQRFIWNGSRSTLGAYNATPGEQRGKYISRTTRNRILRAASMPTTP